MINYYPCIQTIYSGRFIVDVYFLICQVFLKLGEFSAARSNLKKAYIINKTKRSDDLEELKSSLATGKAKSEAIFFHMSFTKPQHSYPFSCFVFVAIKGIRFERKWAKLSEFSLDEQIKILDTLGDLYCQAKSFRKALGFYKREVTFPFNLQNSCIVWYVHHANKFLIINAFRLEWNSLDVITTGLGFNTNTGKKLYNSIRYEW